MWHWQRSKVSLREGENPSILLDDISFWDEEKQTENESHMQEKIKTLYLKFDTTNENLQKAILSTLMDHRGVSPVIVKCSKTNKAYKLPVTITYNNLLEYELLVNVPEDCIKYL